MMQMQPLKTPQLDDELLHISRRMKKLIVGQDLVVDRIVDAMGRFVAGMANPELPLLNMLFLGPTGVGKTETVRVLAEVLFGHRRAFTKVSCEEYAAHYNVSKLLGSPPGYVGGEIRPLLAQENIDRHHLKARENQSGLISRSGSKLANLFPPETTNNLSIVLFDEIEKAHPKLWNLLLGVMEDGTLMLGNNEEVDFRNSIIIFTSNVGSSALSEQIANAGIGFSTGDNEQRAVKSIESTAVRAAKKRFPVEWLNRMSDIVCYHPLSNDDMFGIAKILRQQIYFRCMRSKTCPFLLEASDEAIWHLVNTGSNREMGARPLRNTIEQQVVTPISHYICGNDIHRGDLVEVGIDGSQLIFNRVEGLANFEKRRTDLSDHESWLGTDLGVKDDTGEAKGLPEQVANAAGRAIDAEKG
jgi:ATP-dependent Clp protease ATP-binding subunit ClpC